MQQTSSKPQIGSGIQLSIPNSPAISMPLSIGDLQSSSQQRQRKPSVHSLQTSQINNIHSNSFTSPAQSQSIFAQEYKEELLEQQRNVSFPSSSGAIQINSIHQTPENFYQNKSLLKSGHSIKGSNLINSIQQGCGQIKRIGSTQNSNDGGYTGNILQLEVSFSPLSSTHTSSNSNIQINNLLASSGHTNLHTKSSNNNILNISSPNNEMQRLIMTPQNGQFNHKQNPQLTSIEQHKQFSKQQPLRKNFSSGNISTIQRSSGSVSSKKGFINSYINRNRDAFQLPIPIDNQENKDETSSKINYDEKQQNSNSVAQSSQSTTIQQQTLPQTSTQQYQDFCQLLQEISCQNSIHLYNKNYINNQYSNNQNQSNENFILINNNSSTSSHSYEIINHLNSNFSENHQQQNYLNLPKQISQPWMNNTHQTGISCQQGDHNMSSYFSPLSVISSAQNDIPQQMNSELKPNNLSYTTSSNNLDMNNRDDTNSQNLSFISHHSNNIIAPNSNNNQSATTFQESVSDQKLENNLIGYTQITPFNFSKQEIINTNNNNNNNIFQKDNLQHSQSASSLVNPNSQNKENTTSKPAQMCRNHRFKNAKHFILKDQKHQEFYCYSCSVLLYSQGHELYQIDESLELNAMKMIGEQKKIVEIANKKEAVDKLLFAAKDLIPILKNTMQSMDKKEGDIYKFLETQERNIDSHFNRLIYELNNIRQVKLKQIYECKHDVKQNYLLANAVCQKNAEDLCKMHEDILNNYNSIVLELEESKIWNEAQIQHERIIKQEQLDVLKADQNQFQQMKDQINFLSSNTLKKLQTTYIKLNKNSPCSSPIQRQTPIKNQNSQNSLSKSPVQQLASSQSTNSLNQSRQRKLSQIPINPSNYATQKNTKPLSQQQRQKVRRVSPNHQNYNNSVNNSLRQNEKYDLQDLKQNMNLQMNNIQSKQPLIQLPLQNQERKIKSVQHSINLPNKSVYISFDNKDAFKNHHEIDNKENITYINGIQTVSNAFQQQRIQNVHHVKSVSQPQLICIDLQNIQSQSNNNKILINHGQIPTQEKNQNEQSIPLEDCNTFRNREADYEIENETNMGDYLENVINQANQEKQRLKSQQNLIFKENPINQDQQKDNQQPTKQAYLQDIHHKPIEIYDSIQRQNRNLLHTDSDLDTRVQGQTPNFSNKKKGISSSPRKKISENNLKQDNHVTLREFNYLAEEQKVIEDIVEKEKKSRDNSINKKKQFNDMIKAVQHNQIQRNLNCETILRRVSDNTIDLSQLSSVSTPSHFRSNSSQNNIISNKNSLNSSKNKFFMRSDDQQMSDKHSKSIKKSTLDEILSQKNVINCEEISRIKQKLSFEKSNIQFQNQQEYSNSVSINQEDSRISQTIVKSGVDNNYENILQYNKPNNCNQLNNFNPLILANNSYKEQLIVQHNYPIITEDQDNMLNPLKTTQNSDQKVNEQSQRGVYQPFSQIVDY